MATVLPALHGMFGENEYWVTTMKVPQLDQLVKFPKELPEWEEIEIEEKYQREIRLTRVIKEIAPYFANDPTRFSGALVLAIRNHEKLVFKPLVDFLANSKNTLDETYMGEAHDMGFLSLPQEVQLVPLDGQHRAKALRFAMNGRDDKGDDISGIERDGRLDNDQVTVILLRFDSLRARRIFSKINRYAKPTSKGENLITDDDDAMAVMARSLLGTNGVIPTRLVRIDANTLSAKRLEFTTLATFYECCITILKGLKTVGAGSLHDMQPDQRDKEQQNVKLHWEKLIQGIALWDKALSDPSPSGDATRVSIRQDTLLGKPIGQRALVVGYMLLRDKCEGVPEEDLCERLNKIPWGVNDPIWVDVLTRAGGQVNTGQEVITNAGEFIAYLGGGAFAEEEREQLFKRIYGASWRERSLPDPVA